MNATLEKIAWYVLAWLIGLMAGTWLLLQSYDQSFSLAANWIVAWAMLWAGLLFIFWELGNRSYRFYLLTWFAGCLVVLAAALLFHYWRSTRFVNVDYSFVLWLSLFAEQLVDPSSFRIYNSPIDTPLQSISTGLIVWSLLMLAIWLYTFPIKAPPDPMTLVPSWRWAQRERTRHLSRERHIKDLLVIRSRIRYLLWWIVGLILLIPFSTTLIYIVVPQVAAQLLKFTDPIPLAATWSVVVFLVFLQRGDYSASYITYLTPYRPVWTVLSLVCLAMFLTGYQAYQEVRTRVAGELSVRMLAELTLDQLHHASNATLQTTRAIDADLGNTRLVMARLDECRQNPDVSVQQLEPPETAQEHCRTWESRQVENTRKLEEHMSRLRQHTNDLHARAQGALPQLQTIAQKSTYPGTSVEQINLIVTDITAITKTFFAPDADASAIGRLNAALDTISNPTTSQQLKQQRFQEAMNIVRSEFEVPATHINEQSLVALNSIQGVRITGLATFLWLTGFYIAFVLFPWVLLLMFLYRKRTSIAANIMTDLLRLDPSGGLLKRIIRGPKPGQPEHDLLPMVDTLVAHRGSGSTDAMQQEVKITRLIDALAGRAFSNFEYVLSLLLLSFLTAVGWYYIFYPRTSFGLAWLIEQASGIKELTAFIIDHITPLTLGFAGASFFSIGMLGRRYLADDLYPSAFLQAAQRILVVFILSLLLAFLSPALRKSVPVEAAGVVPAPATASAPAVTPSTTASATQTPVGATPDRNAAFGAELSHAALAQAATPTVTPTPAATITPPARSLAGGTTPAPSRTDIALAVFAFFAGLFPTWTVRAVGSWLSSFSFFNRAIPDLETQPLTDLRGITVWSEARLLEENVENIQAMATAPIEQLVLGTHYPTSTIVDWVDQAILYMRAGKKEYFDAFQAAGIYSASKLLDAAGVDLLQPAQLYEQDFVPGDSELDQIVDAIKESSPDSPLKQNVVRLIVDSIWPDQNLHYILNYYRDIAISSRQHGAQNTVGS
jgi:hypothetical protein